MPRLTEEQAELRRCVEDLDAIERQVNARMVPTGTQTKQIPFEFSESFVFAPGEMKALKRSFKNGAEDLYFSEPSFSVQIVKATVPVEIYDLTPTEAGFQDPFGTTAGDPSGLCIFDFFWNWSVGSQGEKYGSPAQELLWLSRRSLGNRDRWLPLAFRYPLRVKGGDSVTFTLKPAFNMNHMFKTEGENYSIVVNLTLTGRRTGRMAESAFDPEFNRQDLAANPELVRAMKNGGPR